MHVLTSLWLDITTESKKTDIIIINQLIKRIAYSIGKAITLLFTCNCQVLTLLLSYQSQHTTLLYGQEIITTATVKQ